MYCCCIICIMLYHSHLVVLFSHTGTQGPTTGERWENPEVNKPTTIDTLEAL